MKVVITGGAGFIGSNLVERLLTEESVTEVRVLDDFSTGLRQDYADSRVVVHEGDLRDAAFVDSVAEGAQRIIHLGALPSVPRSIADPRSSLDVNVIGTLNVLEAARRHGVGHVVSASSSSVSDMWGCPSRWNLPRNSPAPWGSISMRPRSPS